MVNEKFWYIYLKSYSKISQTPYYSKIIVKQREFIDPNISDVNVKVERTVFM